MDGSRFDQLARTLNTLRTRRTAVGMLGAAFGLPALATLETSAKKKRKKPCARKCKDGCCIGKKGKCIRPDQQDTGRCGTGGEICRSTGCVGTCPNCRCSSTAPCPTGQCCSGNGTCGPCLVFVTSTTKNGNLGGLFGADDICQGLANAAGLPGVYMAWLSDRTGSPASRFTRATVPYVRVDGLTVADNWTDLTGGRLKRPVNITEKGQVNELPNRVWTSTTHSGELPPNPRDDCESWINSTGSWFGDFGSPQAIDSTWTESNMNFTDCYDLSRLYCFQQR